MPGFDGTGPQGGGPLTGGGRGYCAGRYGEAAPVRGRRRGGRGFGRATGRGMGWGRGPAWGWGPGAAPAWPAQEDAAHLRQREAGLKAELESLRGRLAELEQAQQSE
jgi:hypothetical protein